jgi:hypothetical protein
MDQQFRMRGFILLRPEWLAGRLDEIQQMFKQTIGGFPDFRPVQNVWGVRQDGILTNPGSFHNPLSRRLRQCATREIAPIILDLLAAHPTFGMQCVLAPISYSPAARKSKDGARWWYKRSTFEPGEIVLKGFANIGSSTQIFTCAPGTHIYSLSPKSKPIEVFRQMHPNAKDLSKAADCGTKFDCNGRTVKIRVPPGTLVVYHTTLLVKLETSRAVDECTQHFKWLFSTRAANFDAVTKLTQPSKWPSYYPGDFRRTKRENALYRLQAFSRGFVDSRWLTAEPYGNVIPPDTMARVGYRIPPVSEHSLRELGNQYPDYGPDEQVLYSMSRGPWTLGDDELCPFTVLNVDNTQAWDNTRSYPKPADLNDFMDDNRPFQMPVQRPFQDSFQEPLNLGDFADERKPSGRNLAALLGEESNPRSARRSGRRRSDTKDDVFSEEAKDDEFTTKVEPKPTVPKSIVRRKPRK